MRGSDKVALVSGFALVVVSLIALYASGHEAAASILGVIIGVSVVLGVLGGSKKQ